MSATRDFDDIARAWLDLMPDEAPDRALDSVLLAVVATRQARRVPRWPTWRSSPMNRLPAVVAAAAIVAAAGALLVFRPSGPNVGAAPTPTTTLAPNGSVSASPSAPAGQVPSAIRGTWMGQHRDLVDPDAGTAIVFTDIGFRMTQSNTANAFLLASAATAASDTTVRLESAVNGSGCRQGDVGTYSWSLTPSARVLTVTAGQDECASRAAAVAGVWWLMDCPASQDNCLGPIDAGTYQSQFITPRLDPGEQWAPNVGAITYTVPDGWANAADWPDAFHLVPVAEAAKPETDRTRTIVVNTQPTALTQEKPCSDTVDPEVGRTVTDLVTWIRTVPGLVTNAPTAITINGHPGQWLDVRLDPAWTKTCDGETTPIVTYLNPGTAAAGGERERVVLLDLGGGDVVQIGIWTKDGAEFDAFAAETMPIIDSLQFE